MIYITAVHLEGGEGHEHIGSVKWRDTSSEKTGESTRAQMVVWIRDNGGEAYVEDDAGDAKVGVVEGNPPYIRTYADDKWTNNLLALPRY